MTTNTYTLTTTNGGAITGAITDGSPVGPFGIGAPHALSVVIDGIRIPNYRVESIAQVA